MEFKDKQILVLGAGVSGIAVAQILRELGAAVTLSDGKPQEQIRHNLDGLRDRGVELALGRQDETLLAGVDCLVLSPGISIYSPLVQAAQARKITVMSEIEVAYRLCPAPIEIGRAHV